MSSPDARAAPTGFGSPEGEHCVTCGDVAVTMRVVRLDPSRGLALCEADDGERRTVEVELVAPVAEGDSVLVHAGAALARLDAGAERA